MKRLLLILLLLSSSLFSEETLDVRVQKIRDTKEQIKALQADLKKLEASIPKNIEEVKAKELARIEKRDRLVTHTEFGFISTKGNTDTTAYSLESSIKKRWDKHIFELSFDGQYADDKNIETKNKYLIELEYDYAFTDRFAFDYLIGYKDDKFSGYDYQFYTGPGASYKFVKTDTQDLTIEANLLYSVDSIQDIHHTASGVPIDYPYAKGLVADPTKTKYGKVKKYPAFRTKLKYDFQILENLKFNQDLSYRVEIDETANYFVFSKTALISKITDIFSFGINYKVDYVNKPPESKAHSDKTLTANLIIDY